MPSAAPADSPYLGGSLFCIASTAAEKRISLWFSVRPETAVDPLFCRDDTPHAIRVVTPMRRIRAGRPCVRSVPIRIRPKVNIPGKEISLISLRETLGPFPCVGGGDIVASRFCCDSRKVRPGDVFIAVRGATHDGHLYIERAVSAGASAVVTERPHPQISVPQCIVPDSRTAFAQICMALQGRPEKSLTVAGITGTNGKTTSAWLLRSVLEAAGLTTGLLGTIEYSDGRSGEEAGLTTPDAEQLAQLFDRMVRAQASHCVMEVSSHALDQRRCSGVSLSVAAMTNITQDHFDYHGNSDRYRTAKALIAGLLQPQAPLLVGIDDAGCRAAISLLPADTRVVTFGFGPQAQIRAEILTCADGVQDLRLTLLSCVIRIRSPLVGRHNVLNMLTAAAMAEQLGVDADAIRDGLQRVAYVPGRMERIDAGQPFKVFVDYAHTPDGLAQCLITARGLTAGRVILVFGAGGDRDRSKRPLMAQATEGADAIFVTSDNPRSEDPRRIIDEICGGYASTAHVRTSVDRLIAIRDAVMLAAPGDVVMIAGRGHETTQLIGDRHIGFDDRKVTRRLLCEFMRQPTTHRPATTKTEN